MKIPLRKTTTQALYRLPMLLAAALMVVSSCMAQEFGRPFIDNFASKTYKAHIQNWDVAQDQRGIMYFGNSDGLLTYDGTYWNIFQLPSKETVRAIDISPDQTIYVGAVKSFGYVQANSRGEWTYVPLDSLIENRDSVFFDDVWQVKATANKVYFRTYHYIFVYDGKNIKTLHSKERILSDFLFDDKFYVLINNQLHVVEQNQMVSIPKPEGSEQFHFRAAVKYNANNLLMVTGLGNLFLYNIKNNTVRTFDSEANPMLRQNSVYTMAKAPNNCFAIGTSENGMIIIDENGKIVQTANQQKGLQNDEIFALYTDKQNNIWAGLNNGISKVELANPISYWNTSDGLLGAVEAIINFKKQIYISTHRGTFVLKNNEIKRIFNRSEQCWTLYAFRHTKNNTETLLAGTSSGLYKVTNDKFQVIDNQFVVFELSQSKKNPEILYIAHGNGFARAKYRNNTFTEITNFAEINDNVRSVTEDIDGSVWLGTFRNGAIKVVFDDSLNIKSHQYYKQNKGLPGLKNVLTYQHNNAIVFATEKGLYKYNPHTDSIVPEQLLGNYHQQHKADVFSFVQTHSTIWYSGLNKANSRIAFAYTNADSLQWITQPFERIPEMFTLAFHVDTNQTAWIGGSEGLFKFDSKNFNPTSTSFNAHISKVSIGADSVLFKGNYFNPKTQRIQLEQPQNYVHIIEYKNNTISFEYSCSNFINPKANEYQIKLENFNNEWSAWTNKTLKEYSYLPPGKYTFKVRARNNINISNTASYSFTIKAPWYQTTGAYLLYAGLIVLVFYLAIKFNIRRLEKANKKLEEIVAERTQEIRKQNQEILQQNAEISQQKEEIMAQAEQLEYTNHELEKLSIVARETDNAIAILDANGNFEWFNEAFTRLYGYTLETWIQKYGKNIKHSSSNKQIDLSLKQVITTGKSIIYETQNTTAKGEKIWVQTTLTPILNYDGTIDKLVAIDSNIAQIKLAEQEIIQQKEEILTQKNVLEEQNERIFKQSRALSQQNRNIKSSIKYAQTIQQSILPAKKNMDKFFDSFIIYLPKDIVSGDYYWYLPVWLPNHKHPTTFVAVVDCTGHGVPGAFMSIISSRMLNEIVQMKAIYQPAEILSQLNQMIETSLKQDINDNKDGLDIALCKIENIDQHRRQITFAGAKRPLYYRKKDGTKIEVIRGTRRSIGGLINFTKIEFEQKEIILNKEDLLYLSSDGFVDQNNKERRRFSSRKWKNLLDQIWNQSLEKQKDMLLNALQQHQKHEAQRDDITVLGIKIK